MSLFLFLYQLGEMVLSLERMLVVLCFRVWGFCTECVPLMSVSEALRFMVGLVTTVALLY